MNHLMLDLETLDTAASAAVLSLGGVAFSVEGSELKILDTIHLNFVSDLQDQLTRKRTVSASTLTFWMMQSVEAREGIVHGATALRICTSHGLMELSKFVNRMQVSYLWGNGAAFDNAILASLCATYSFSPVVRHSGDRCYRTLCALNPDVERPERVGVYHDALDDARTQVRHMQAILEAKGRL